MLTPKLLALDTSHFGQLVKDANSRRAEDRRRALAFQESLDRMGWIYTFSYHHLAEIHGHNDPSVRANRLAYIRSIPLLAYVRSENGPEAGFGSVINVLAAEIKAALAVGTSDPAGIVAAARSTIFAYDQGAAVMYHLDAIGPVLGEIFRTQAARDRQVVAISRADVEKPPDVTISELLRHRLRTPEDRQAFLARFGETLFQEVANRGDERIEHPRAVADGFTNWVQEMTEQVGASDMHPVFLLLQRMGLRREDIGPNVTLSELLRISLHRERALVAAQAAGIAARDVVERVRTDRLPSAIIGDAMERFGQEPKRRIGSVLNDVSLVCLSPYVDVTTVDKGTFGNVGRAAARSSSFKSIIGKVVRRPAYSDLIDELAAK